MQVLTSIFNTVLSFGRSFSRLNEVGQLVVTVALVFLAFSFGNCSGEDKLNSFIVEYNEFKKDAQKTTEFADSLKTTVVKLEDAVKVKENKIKKLTIGITFKQNQAHSLVQELSLLEARTSIIADTAKILILKDSTIDNLKTQVATTETIVEEKDKIIKLTSEQLLLTTTSLQLSSQRSDSLQNRLLLAPPTPKNPSKLFGVIPMPSRKAVAISALLAGIAIGVATTK